MKYTESAFTGPLSGSAGSITASHNRGGAYFRIKSIPTNPNSTRQQAVRSIFGDLVQAWANTLTDAQRLDWKTYGDNTPILDVLGNQIFLTGQNQYIRSNSPRIQAGLARIDAAPTIFNTGEPVTSIQTTLGATVGEIGVDMGDFSTTINVASGASDDGDVLLYFGVPINSTRNFFKGPYQFAEVLAIASAATSVALASATSLGAQAVIVAAGQYRGLRARIAYDDGRLSQPFDVLADVVADSA